MEKKPRIGPFVRQMARWYGITPEEYAEQHGGEPEGLIMSPGEDEPMDWLTDRLARAPIGDIVISRGADGFLAVCVDGVWMRRPPFKISVADVEKFTEIPQGSFEHASLAREARRALEDKE